MHSWKRSAKKRDYTHDKENRVRYPNLSLTQHASTFFIGFCMGVAHIKYVNGDNPISDSDSNINATERLKDTALRPGAYFFFAAGGAPAAVPANGAAAAASADSFALCSRAIRSSIFEAACFKPCSDPTTA
jgi:hypothetical protein